LGADGPIEAQWACPKCGAAAECADLAGAATLSCPCGWSNARHVDTLRADGRPVRCPLCGDPRLYVQKDFSRRVGLGMLVGGFALAVLCGIFVGPVGFFGVLGASAALDAVLYLLAGQVVVCHWCETHLRGGPEDYPDFDLETHDLVRHQKEVAAAGHAVPAHEGLVAPGDAERHPTRYDG
jgi:hypothetical protein